MEVLVTKHAHDRLKERLGLPKSARARMAAKAFELGLKRGDVRGKLRQYLGLCSTEYGRCNNIRVYGEYLWLFDGAILVTVFLIPKSMRSGIQK